MSTTAEPTDRLFGALPYLLPLVYALPFGIPLLMKFPILSVIYLPLQPLIQIYSFPFAGLIIFFILYSAVVRNTNISYFIRFNTLQAILIDIGLILFGLVIRLFGVGGGGLLVETLSNVAFLATLIACIYAMIQSFLGKYAELPTVSQAAYAQLPY
ncbi:MAG: Tic20 family protein [Limnothrix sp.]